MDTHNKGIAPGQSVLPVSFPSSGCAFQPWMRPLFKLNMLLLAKMQWDVRQCPEVAVTTAVMDPWPAKVLRPGIMSQMVSPCVAGDLLQQRAPGLVPHAYVRKRLAGTPSRPLWAVVEQRIPNLAHDLLGDFLVVSSRTFRACIQDDTKLDIIGKCSHHDGANTHPVGQRHGRQVQLRTRSSMEGQAWWVFGGVSRLCMKPEYTTMHPLCCSFATRAWDVQNVLAAFVAPGMLA
jgi:hypothetical protein